MRCTELSSPRTQWPQDTTDSDFTEGRFASINSSECIHTRYYSEYYDLRDHEHGAGRLIQAGKNRMRPIAMTTLAAILALLPLAMVFSPGAAMQQPLAVAIISGLVAQMPLTLLVLPVLLGFRHEPAGKVRV